MYFHVAPNESSRWRQIKRHSLFSSLTQSIALFLFHFLALFSLSLRSLLLLLLLLLLSFSLYCFDSMARRTMASSVNTSLTTCNVLLLCLMLFSSNLALSHAAPLSLPQLHHQVLPFSLQRCMLSPYFMSYHSKDSSFPVNIEASFFYVKKLPFFSLHVV